MRLTVSHLRMLYRHGRCTIRIARGMAGHKVDDHPSEHVRMLWQQGHAHEDEVVAGYGEHLDLSDGELRARISRTRAELSEPTMPVLRHALLEQPIEIDGTTIELRGEPDLLVAEGDGTWRIVEAKLTLREETLARSQLGLYALLLERTTGTAPTALEIMVRGGELVSVPLDDAIAAGTSDLRALLELRDAPPVWEPVNATRCTGCLLHHECWSRAIREHDVAALPAVKQRAARVLRHHGLGTFEALADADPASLPGLAVPDELGSGGNQIGKATAPRMVAQAAAMRAGAAWVTAAPALPDAATWVMFDVENLPPPAPGQPIRVFQWGLKAFRGGEAFLLANDVLDVTDEQADRAGWFSFLARARDLLDLHPDARFAHWHGHDAKAIESYVERFGDDEHATAAAVLERCVDLLVVVKDCCELPALDRSIKKVAAWLGADLADHALGGAGAIAQYERLVSGDAGTDAPWIRDRLERYNECDLDALKVALDWLQRWSGAPAGSLVDRDGRVLVGEVDPDAEPATEMEPFQRTRSKPSNRLPLWRERQIESIAIDLLERCGIDDAAPAPVQVRQVAALLKLKIVDSPDGVAGVATVNDDGRPLSGFMHQGTLTIDEREPERRRRFTIAHEVAHVVLGHQSVLGESHKLLAELLDDDVERLFGPRSSASVAQAEASRLVEREANLLAGQLLVPDRALDAALAEHGVCLPVLAGVFDVSVPLVRVRLGSRISPTIRRVSVW